MDVDYEFVWCAMFRQVVVDDVDTVVQQLQHRRKTIRHSPFAIRHCTFVEVSDGMTPIRH